MKYIPGRRTTTKSINFTAHFDDYQNPQEQPESFEVEEGRKHIFPINDCKVIYFHAMKCLRLSAMLTLQTVQLFIRVTMTMTVQIMWVTFSHASPKYSSTTHVRYCWSCPYPFNLVMYVTMLAPYSVKQVMCVTFVHAYPIDSLASHMCDFQLQRQISYSCVLLFIQTVYLYMCFTFGYMLSPSKFCIIFIKSFCTKHMLFQSIKDLISLIFSVFLHHLLFSRHMQKIQWIFKIYKGKIFSCAYHFF